MSTPGEVPGVSRMAMNLPSEEGPISSFIRGQSSRDDHLQAFYVNVAALSG
jgi:hypothetical protein